jgi:methionine-rich copper-binding protein CopC
MSHVRDFKSACFRTLISIGLLAPALHAHAILKSATPSAQQVVAGPELPIELHFNSRIDGKRSRILLVAPDGASNPLPIGEQSAPETLNSKAVGLKHGSYTLRWQVLANDGHITRGEIPFKVE